MTRDSSSGTDSIDHGEPARDGRASSPSDEHGFESYMFGQDLDWEAPSTETFLYVELPFWLMVRPCSLAIPYEGALITVDICGPQFEAFIGDFLDSRRSLVHRGPRLEGDWQPTPDMVEFATRADLPIFQRPCKTVLRVETRALTSAFQEPREGIARLEATLDAYWASLCEAHIPVVNEVIQRYRLVTYDYFAYEVSSWDVPVWFARQGDQHVRAQLVPYRDWDHIPVKVVPGQGPGAEPVRERFEFTEPQAIAAASSSTATPGEFELMDARSLMERGDFTGAVRRATTAIEAVLEWALRREFAKNALAAEEVERKLLASQNDFPGRFRQLRKLLPSGTISEALVKEFDRTRSVRHAIVHRAHRISHAERGSAQRSVDTGRWLFNAIEGLPDRARLRDFGTLKSVGRAALAPRFPTVVTAAGIRVESLGGMP